MNGTLVYECVNLASKHSFNFLSLKYDARIALSGREIGKDKVRVSNTVTHDSQGRHVI